MSMILSYLADNNINYVITLPNPDFEDSISTKYVKIINYSRGKELIVGKKSGYDNLSAIRTLKYNFNYINEIVKQEFLKFLETTAGKMVELKDYNDLIWNIVILDAIEFTAAGRNNNTFTLEAEVIFIGKLAGPWLIPQGLLSELETTQGYGV